MDIIIQVAIILVILAAAPTVYRAPVVSAEVLANRGVPTASKSSAPLPPPPPTKPAYAAKAAATTNSLADDVELITAPEYTGLREPAPEAASIHKQGKRVHGGGVAASLLALPLAPLTGLLGLITVREMTEALIFRWGR